MVEKPKTTSSLAEQEMHKVEKQLESFESSVKDLTLDRMASAPKQEAPMQTEMSTSQIAKAKDVYLKPERTTMGSGKFNEEWRNDYNESKEFVHFIAENKEIIGETIEIWTRAYPGTPAEFWKVPTNKPVWGPRYLAEQIKRKYYHRLTMQQNRITTADGYGSYFGDMVADTTVQRLDAHPVSKNKSIFMGAKNF